MFSKKSEEARQITIEELIAMIGADQSGKIVTVDGTMSLDHIGEVKRLYNMQHPNSGLEINQLPGNKTAFFKPKNASTQATSPSQPPQTHQQRMDQLDYSKSSLEDSSSKPKTEKKKWGF